jgi:hypothetical protein
MTSGARHREVGPAGVGGLQAAEVVTAETAVTVEVVPDYQFASFYENRVKDHQAIFLVKQLEADFTFSRKSKFISLSVLIFCFQRLIPTMHCNMCFKQQTVGLQRYSVSLFLCKELLERLNAIEDYHKIV